MNPESFVERKETANATTANTRGNESFMFVDCKGSVGSKGATETFLMIIYMFFWRTLRDGNDLPYLLKRLLRRILLTVLCDRPCRLGLWLCTKGSSDQPIRTVLPVQRVTPSVEITT